MLIEDIQTELVGRPYELAEVASGWIFRTKTQFADAIKAAADLGDQSLAFTEMELGVLCAIAYHQPITRSEIEEIRGVTVGTQLMRGLMERGWVKIVGQRDVPGRPSLYATTKEFLDYFGLQHLRELPELPSLPDLKSIELELPIEEPESSQENTQTLN